MVFVELYGGLGNQMFQYAAARSLSSELGARLYLNTGWFREDKDESMVTPREFSLDVFDIQLKKVGLIDRVLLKFSPVQVVREDEVKNNFYGLKNNLLLDGYWQSEKYFKKNEVLIRKDFNFVSQPNIYYPEIYKVVNADNSVSVHVRRGDYLTNPAAQKTLGALPISYYVQAAKKIRKLVNNPNFVVFSDDIRWCKEHLKLGEKTTYYNHENPWEDLYFMSRCKHNIIANSSFSWWGAWLNSNRSKVVVSPKRWFNDKTMSSDNIIPRSWVRI